MPGSTNTPAKANSVRYGLKRLFFAKRNADGTYEVPWANPGAETANVTNGSNDRQVIDADDRDFFSKASAGSKQIELTVTRFIRKYYTEFLGQQVDSTTGGLVESPDDVSSQFACMYEVTGDQGSYRTCFFNCTSTVPVYNSGTNTNSGSTITESPETATLTASAAEMSDGKEHTVITLEPGDEGYEDFFKAVPLAKTATAA